jgi:hypothetical protein
MSSPDRALSSRAGNPETEKLADRAASRDLLTFPSIKNFLNRNLAALEQHRYDPILGGLLLVGFKLALDHHLPFLLGLASRPSSTKRRMASARENP